MELSTEFDFCFDVLVVITECHLSQLDTKSELASFCHFVLILNVRMHITKEQLFVLLITQSDSNTLVR